MCLTSMTTTSYSWDAQGGLPTLQADPGLDGLSDKDDMNSPALVDPLVQVRCLGIGPAGQIYGSLQRHRGPGSVVDEAI